MQALDAGDRQRLHLAGLDVRQRRGEPWEQRLRLAAEDVGDRRADAAVRDVRDVNTAVTSAAPSPGASAYPAPDEPYDSLPGLAFA